MTVLPILHLIVPCYNEEAILDKSLYVLNEVLVQLIRQNLIHAQSQLVFVDDGSTDRTWSILSNACQKYERLNAIKLSHNQGHQLALWAGYEFSVDRSDLTITLDADLQDDLTVLNEFLLAHQAGSDIVYGVRNNRITDTWFKRWSAQLYYRLMLKMGVELVYNHADYRLLSKRALQALLQHTERNLFIRGMIPSLGFKSTTVSYKRQEREAGESKYPLPRMIQLALEGVTSFSIKPLRYITGIGCLIIFFSGSYLGYIFYQYFAERTVSGWSSIITSIWLLGGLQLFALGIIGEYIGNIYRETKRRPRYFKERVLEASITSREEVNRDNSL